MSRTPFPYRTALRTGRRLAFAKAGRAALIVALIAIPTTGFAGVAVLFQSTQATQTESLDHELGRALGQMQVQGPDLPGMRQDPVNWQWTHTDPGSPLASADESAPDPDLLASVPDEWLAIPVTPTQLVVQGPQGPVALAGTEGSTWDDALDGHWRVLEGTAPTSRDQLMLTPATLDRLDLRIGDTLDVSDPVTRRFTVTGTMRDLGTDPDEQGVFVPWGTTTDDPVPTASWRNNSGYDTTVYLPSHAPTWSEIRALNGHGIIVQSRPVVLDPPAGSRLPDAVPGSSVGWYLAGFGLVGVFAMFEVVLLAGAAFLVGTRADTRSYAILASVGGDRRFVRTVVIGSGLVLGATGAVLGTALGVGVGVLAYRLLDNGNVASFPGLHVPVVMLLVIAVAAVLAGVVASATAARAATRVNVLAALRGSTRPTPPSRSERTRRRVWGPLLIVLGAVMTLACGVGVLVLNDRPRQGEPDHWAWVVGAGVALGPCLVQVGVAICSPWVLALVSRIASRLGISARLAARDARRNPVRTVPVLASVMSVVFVASVLVTWLSSAQAGAVRDYEYRSAVGVATSEVSLMDDDGYSAGYDAAVTAHAAQVVSRVLDHDRIRVLGVLNEQTGQEPADLTLLHQWPSASCPAVEDAACPTFLQYAASGRVLTGTVDDYALLTGSRPSAAVRDALAGGQAVALWPEFQHDGAVRFDTFADQTADGTAVTSTTRPDRTTSIPAVLDARSPRIDVGVFMTRETAARYGVPAVDGMLVTTLPHDVDEAQWDALSSAWQSYGGTDRDRWSGPSFFYEQGPVDGNAPVKAVALALAAAVTIGATSVAVGLARSDGRRDDEVLDAIGAAPRLRRRVSTWQAAILAAVGALVGAALGLLPIRALTLRFTETPAGVTHMPFAPDWVVLAVLAVGLPLVVTVGTWVTAGRGRRIAVRRAH